MPLCLTSGRSSSASVLKLYSLRGAGEGVENVERSRPPLSTRLLESSASSHCSRYGCRRSRSHHLAVLLRGAVSLHRGGSRNSDLEILRRGGAAGSCYLDFWSIYLGDCEESPLLFSRRVERGSFRGTPVVSRLLGAEVFTLVYSTSFTPQ